MFVRCLRSTDSLARSMASSRFSAFELYCPNAEKAQVGLSLSSRATLHCGHESPPAARTSLRQSTCTQCPHRVRLVDSRRRRNSLQMQQSSLVRAIISRVFSVESWSVTRSRVTTSWSSRTSAM